MLAAMLRRALVGCVLALALAGCQSLPELIDATMKQGEALYAQKKYDEAIARFNEVLHRDPNHFRAHVWIARVQIAKGAWNPAIASARRAWALAPRHADVVPVLAQALFGAGNAALGTGRFGESIPLFMEYLELQPGNPSAWVNVARAYLGEKRFAEALASVLRALGISPDGATQKEALDLLLDGARRALLEGDLANVIRFLSEYLKIDPANLRAWLDLARSHLKTGDYDRALAAFADGLKQGGGAERGQLLRELLDAGNQALSGGRLREGTALLREYVTHDRGNIEVLLNLARASWIAGERMRAIDALRQIKEVNPRHQEALKYMLGQ